MKMVRGLVAAVALVMSAGAAQASLIGDQVTVSYLSPNTATVVGTDVVTIGAGSEIVCPGAFSLCSVYPGFDLDFAADSVTFRSGLSGILSNQTFNGFSFTDLDFGPGLVLASLTLDTNISGLDLGDIAFGNNFARVNLSGLAVTSQSFFALNFTTREVSAVPEPGAVGLLGLGLMGLGLALRRRNG